MILSVSRRTDIPNYYSDWFYNRLREGFLYVRNPVNAHQISRIDLSPEVVDCIVFWTKNPAGMLERLDELEKYPYYFQFTLTGYGRDVEPGLPDKRRELIATFQKLSMKTGKRRVVWRYDPIFLTERYTMEYHLRAFEEIASCLAGYTQRVVISFLDLYAVTQRNMAGLQIQEISEENMQKLVQGLVSGAERYGIQVESCAEVIDLQKVGVRHGSCIDKILIEEILGCRLTGSRDRNQRQACGCFESVETGAYNTCRNGCRYCYANHSQEMVRANVESYDANAPLLCGTVGPEDRITERKVRSLKELQLSLFEKKTL